MSICVCVCVCVFFIVFVMTCWLREEQATMHVDRMIIHVIWWGRSVIDFFAFSLSLFDFFRRSWTWWWREEKTAGCCWCCSMTEQCFHRHFVTKYRSMDFRLFIYLEISIDEDEKTFLLFFPYEDMSRQRKTSKCQCWLPCMSTDHLSIKSESISNSINSDVKNTRCHQMNFWLFLIDKKERSEEIFDA